VVGAGDGQITSESLQTEVRFRLANAGVDTTALNIEFRGSTALLTGAVQDGEAHVSIIEALLAISAVNRVVDALRVGNVAPSPQIYMKQGAPLKSAMQELFDPNVTWEEYRAAKKGINKR
jgi:hypothetical protein